MKMNVHRIILIVAVIFYQVTSSYAQWQRNINEPLPTRQVHLDFHTSEFIPEIGEKFDKKQFQEALKIGRINQINIFAKGHHGWSYYPTETGKMHPNLKFDLLGAEMEACHEIGVKCPIYFTVGWSVRDAEEHPEWCVRKKDGSIAAMNVKADAKQSDIRPNYSWKCLDASYGGPYHEYIKKQVEELCKRYKQLDGFWFDIYHIAPVSYSEFSIKRMKAEGVDMNDAAAVERSFALALKAHMKDLRELITKYHPQATVFFNTATHINNKAIFKQRLFDMNTHAELEDLPTTWGGYDKLPLEAKYHLQQGTPAVAMSGKFHKAWGEFGGFKHPDAIKYEASAMVSFGASCNFGDQLHPSGEMDLETYRNIGEAYKYVEKIEKYGPGGIPVSKLGIWLTLNNEADHGIVNMLLQLHQDFIVADENRLSNLELLIIPGSNCLSSAQAKKINDWVKKGGKLIVFGNGALNKESNQFILDVGCEYKSKSAYNFDYTSVKPLMGKGIVKSPFLNYEPGLLVKPTSGVVLANIREPYFNRTYSHYSSHRETPYKLEDSAFPAIVKNGNVIFFAHQLDRLYYTHGVRIHRELVKNAIEILYKHPILKVNKLPSAGRVSLLKQVKQHRYVVHLLYGPPILRGEVEVIEDLVPISNVQIELDVPETVKNIYQIPDGKKLKYRRIENKIVIDVPAFTMHTGIVLEY
ncbi:MAG: alpha-amylase family protein [Niabella sp.]